MFGRIGRTRQAALAGTAVLGLMVTAAPGADGYDDERPGPDARVIDLAICLDTSGSMNGLIDSARQKLWAIVNDLALARPAPTLRVALLTFGNDGHSAEDGWVNVETPFTEDLDLVSERLFAQQTNGGTEYVGRVLRAASGLGWHPSTDALKLVLVAGNESADQDQAVPFRDVCRELIAKDVIVNSIYCGPVEDELAPVWKEVATLADGQFACIDQNSGTLVIETPFDGELADLSAALNETYLPYGARGEWSVQNQAVQDANAAGLNAAAAAERCSTKASGLYSCGSWDLVDASRGEGFDLSAIAPADLPEAMRSMTPDERAAHIEAMGRRRAEIQARVKVASDKRQAFISEAMKAHALDDSLAFDAVVRTAIRAQAVARGFAFPPPPEVASSGNN